MEINASRRVRITGALSMSISDGSVTTDFAILVVLVLFNRLTYGWMIRQAINRTFNIQYILQLINTSINVRTS
jgi:glyoxylate carboligase